MAENPFASEDLIGRAEQGDFSAQFELGVRYKNGAMVPKDMNAAKHWLMKAVEQGNENAIATMVEILIGEQLPSSKLQAFEILKGIRSIDQFGGRRPWEQFDIYEPGCEFLREKGNLHFLADHGHEQARLEVTRLFLIHRGLLDERSEGLAWWVMPIFGITPSILCGPSLGEPPFYEAPAVSLALANYQRAEEWLSSDLQLRTV